MRPTLPWLCAVVMVALSGGCVTGRDYLVDRGAWIAANSVPARGEFSGEACERYVGTQRLRIWKVRDDDDGQVFRAEAFTQSGGSYVLRASLKNKELAERNTDDACQLIAEKIAANSLVPAWRLDGQSRVNIFRDALPLLPPPGTEPLVRARAARLNDLLTIGLGILGGGVTATGLAFGAREVVCPTECAGNTAAGFIVAGGGLITLVGAGFAIAGLVSPREVADRDDQDGRLVLPMTAAPPAP